MRIEEPFYDEFEEELDPDFLQRYANGRVTLAVAETTINGHLNDGDDEEDLYDRLIEEIPNTSIPVLYFHAPTTRQGLWQEKADEVRRRERRRYQERYRAGLVPPARAKTFQRRSGHASTGEPLWEERQKITYYLPDDLRNIVRQVTRANRIERRHFCVQALEWLLSSQSVEDVYNARNTQMPFKNRVFQFDEIPTLLWQRIDVFCRDGGSNRRLRLYQVVEAALSGYLRQTYNIHLKDEEP